MIEIQIGRTCFQNRIAPMVILSVAMIFVQKPSICVLAKLHLSCCVLHACMRKNANARLDRRLHARKNTQESNHLTMQMYGAFFLNACMHAADVIDIASLQVKVRFVTCKRQKLSVAAAKVFMPKIDNADG